MVVNDRLEEATAELERIVRANWRKISVANLKDPNQGLTP